jgi:hypothetical protein
MARIDEYLQKILSARYGEEVRGAIHDSIDEINRVNEANISTVQTIADTAQGYADDAEESKDLAAQSVTDAQAQVTLAQQQVTLATTQATNSANSAEDSEAWAVGQRGGVDVPSSDETYQNNSKYWQERANYWYQQAQAIAESFSGALRPMGTVTFENLPPLAQADSGDMYNVSNQFTTTSDFVEGAGIVVPLGSNVYKTVGGKWDVLAGSPVTGVKGNSESSYRRGNVNITKSNIGLGNVDNTSDTNKPISTAQQAALNSKQNITDNSLNTTNKTVPGAINEINTSLTDLSSVVYSAGTSLISVDITSAQDLTPSEPFTNFNTIKVRIGAYYGAQNKNIYMQAFDIDLRHLNGAANEFMYSWYISDTNFMSVAFGIQNGKLTINSIDLGTVAQQNFAVYVEAYGYRQTL